MSWLLSWGSLRSSLFPGCCPTTRVRTITELQARGSYLEPGAMDKIIADLTEMYGLERFADRAVRRILDALVSRRSRRLILSVSHAGDELIAAALPWTAGLLIVTTSCSPGPWAISWAALPATTHRKRWSRAVDAVAMVIRPYALLHLCLCTAPAVRLFRRWFPVSGGAGTRAPAELELALHSRTCSGIRSCRRSRSPSSVAAVWFQTMKLVVQNVNAEDFVQYAKIGGVEEEPDCHALRDSQCLAPPNHRRWRWRWARSSAGP